MCDQRSKHFLDTTKILSPGFIDMPLLLCYIHVYNLVILNVFYSETVWPVFTRFHIGPSVKRVLSVCSYGSASFNKMSAMFIYGKNTEKPPEPRKLQGWILVYSIWDSRSTKFVEVMILEWHLTFLWQGQICIPILLYGENVGKSFSKNVLNTGWNIQGMIKVVQLFSYNQNFVP